MTKVSELFGENTTDKDKLKWKKILTDQHCPYLNRKCIKSRKSQPEISIGTCSVRYGKSQSPVMICPHRLLERRQIFLDCFHLIKHEPGNEIHVIPEVKIPGGNVDFVLASVKNSQVEDFVGIEIQTLDTTGTVWPERQRFLSSVGVKVDKADFESTSTFGMNWKMTAKTILVQLHHKAETFEHINKNFVLVVQDRLMDYMKSEFNFGHISNPANNKESVHFHSYSLTDQTDETLKISLSYRNSTDVEGVKKCLGLFSEAKVEYEEICKNLNSKISVKTLFQI